MTRSRTYLEKLLFLAGVIGVGLWLGSNLAPVIWQSWENWAFDRQVQREPAAVARPQPAQPPPLENNALIGRLTIPRLNLSTTVREGISEGTLVLAAGHIPGTALPGGNGNVGVAGHRDTLFRNLAGIRKNDLIQFETPHGNYEYYVASIEIVAPEDVRVLRPSPHSELTLVTCYPFDYLGSAPERFVVKARQMPGSPLPGDPGKTFRLAPPEKPEPAGTDLPAGTAVFHIGKRRSQQLAPGISLGVDDTEAASSQMDGWMWIMPDRRTIWLRDHAAQQPLTFYQNGRRRILMITTVTASSVTGYLLGRDRPLAR